MNKNYLPTNGTKVQKWYKTIKRTLTDRLKLYGKSHFYYPKVSIIPSSKANTKPYLLCINGKLQTAISRGSDMLKKSTEIRHICRYSNKVWEFSYVLNLAASWFNASAKNIERNSYKSPRIVCDIWRTEHTQYSVFALFTCTLCKE